MRFVLTFLAALLLPAGLFAAKGKPATPKPNNSAQIQALEHHKREILNQEKAHLHQIETHFKTTLEQLHQQKSHLEKAHIAQLEAEKHQAVKLVEQRYAHLLKYQKPYEVWGQLEQDTKTLRGVVQHLQHADHDYGGRRAAAVRSLDAAVRTLHHRLSVHHWSANEKQATVQHLQTAETDLQNALAYAAAKYGAGTPKGMPESQARSNEQLSAAVGAIDRLRALVLHAQWEEGQDAGWAARMKKQESEELHKVRTSYDARLKAVDKEVSQHIQQHVKQLEQQKHQAVAQLKSQTQAAVQQINQQIAVLKR